MAIFFSRNDRHVIPNFRNFKKTTELGELDSFKKLSTRQIFIPNIIDYKNEWEDNKTVAHAADLLSAVITNNVKSDKVINEAANFILESSKFSTSSQIDLAKRILNIEDAKINAINLSKITQFIETNNHSLIFDKIRELKKSILKFNKNPIAYVELARYYSIIGQIEKANYNLQIALNLSPNNRYVIRSLVRFLFNYNDIEQAHDIVRRNERTNFDPWLMSAELALSTARNRGSKFVKRGIEIVTSDKYHPHSYTELASSIGTIELLHGNFKKSKQFFNASLKSPNDNSLAQAEWASERDVNIVVNPADFQVSYDYEAQSMDFYHKAEWEQAARLAEDWFIDMPFAKAPALFGSHIAIAFLDNNKESANFCRAGLISNPNDPQLLNNLAYSLANTGKPNEAEEYINKVFNNPTIGEVTKLCAYATLGLINYKKGNIDAGRYNYQKAIEEARLLKNAEYLNLATINYVKEEILVGNPQSGDFIKMLKENKEIDVRKDLSIQRKRVEDLFLSRTSQKGIPSV